MTESNSTIAKLLSRRSSMQAMEAKGITFYTTYWNDGACSWKKLLTTRAYILRALYPGHHSEARINRWFWSASLETLGSAK
jgi:hypothetical protein